MDEFVLERRPGILVGAGRSQECGEQISLIAGGAVPVMLVCDPALVALGLVEPVATSLRAAGHSVEIFDKLSSDPNEQSVDVGVAETFMKETGCVVALGGGSAIDTGKLIATLAGRPGPSSAYRLAAQPMPYRRIPLIVIPTTAGTGAETTKTAIISDETGCKNWFWGPQLVPDLAILDPLLTVGLPPFWTFFTGMDALVHAIESRTNRNRFVQNDPIAEEAILGVVIHLERAVKQPDDIDARLGMLKAAAWAGLAIGNTGCAVAHNIGHALGSLAGVPHGRAVSIALAATTDWAVEGSRDAFDRVGELLGGRGAADVVPRFRGLAEACGFPLSLSDEERGKLNAEALGAEMLAPANISMIEATAHYSDPSQARPLAEAVLAA